jgi:hypothetical protein
MGGTGAAVRCNDEWYGGVVVVAGGQWIGTLLKYVGLWRKKLLKIQIYLDQRFCV